MIWHGILPSTFAIEIYPSTFRIFVASKFTLVPQEISLTSASAIIEREFWEFGISQIPFERVHLLRLLPGCTLHIRWLRALFYLTSTCTRTSSSSSLSLSSIDVDFNLHGRLFGVGYGIHSVFTKVNFQSGIRTRVAWRRQAHHGSRRSKSNKNFNIFGSHKISKKKVLFGFPLNRRYVRNSSGWYYVQ